MGASTKSAYDAALDRLYALSESDATEFAMNYHQIQSDVKTIQEYGVSHDDRLDNVLAKISLLNTAYSLSGTLADKRGHSGTAAFINNSSMQFDTALAA